jgi:hypothetical protein
MEIKVGDYVRIRGYIDKIININDFREPDMKYALEQPAWNGDIMFIGDKDIVKSSLRIIDLIEVGDYVNGEKVVRIDKDKFIKGQIDLWTNRTTVDTWGDICLSPIIDKNIKTIVTKEQFERMEYKVGD